MGRLLIATVNDEENCSILYKKAKKNFKELGFEIIINNNIKDVINYYSKADAICIEFKMAIKYYNTFQKLYNTEYKDTPIYIIRNNRGESSKEYTHLYKLGALRIIRNKEFNSKEFSINTENLVKRRKKYQIENEITIDNDMINWIDNKTNEIIDGQLATLNALAQLAESRDKTTGEHLERVKEVCSILVLYLQTDEKYSALTNSKAYNIIETSIVHDIGKVGIEDKILNKPSKLSAEEFNRMKEHVDIGIKIMEKLIDLYTTNEYLETGLEIIAYHHEKWDGTGYPYGLKGLEIPLSARIMAIVDVYDALRSSRPYKKPLGHKESIKIIQSEQGKHFDPLLVSIFLSAENEIKNIYKDLIEEKVKIGIRDVASS